MATTKTKVLIILPFDARLQIGDCSTQNEVVTEPFDVIERVVVCKMRDSARDQVGEYV